MSSAAVGTAPLLSALVSMAVEEEEEEGEVVVVEGALSSGTHSEGKKRPSCVVTRKLGELSFFSWWT